MLVLIDVLPRAFTSDPAVIERAQEIWVLFALMQPANGAVFALDGILIGAGDTRFLMWGMLVAALGVSCRSRWPRSRSSSDRGRVVRAGGADCGSAHPLRLALLGTALGGHGLPTRAA